MTQLQQPPLQPLPPDETASANAQLDAPLVLDDEHGETQAHIVFQLKVLAHPIRWKLVQMLAQAQETMCVLELAARFPVTKHTVCNHLRRLYHAKILDVRRVGLYSYYAVQPEALSLFQQQLATLERQALRSDDSSPSYPQNTQLSPQGIAHSTTSLEETP